MREKLLFAAKKNRFYKKNSGIIFKILLRS